MGKLESGGDSALLFSFRMIMKDKAGGSMQEFLKSHKFKIIILIIALLFGMMLYSASGDGVENIPRNLLEIVTTPIQKIGSTVSNGVGTFFGWFVDAKKNADENEQLHQQVAELNQKLVDYEKLKDENEQLKTIAGIKELYPDFEIIPASVISRDPADRYASFMIDKGSLHGIQVNDPIITQNGLVGIVTHVGSISSRVKTILSPEISVGAYEISSKELGMVKGDIALSEKGLTKFSILSDNTLLKKGDMISTAGASGLYPKGIPIGYVDEIQTESHGVTKYAMLLPMESIDEVVNVQVVTNFLGQGSGPLDDFDD